MSVQTIRMTDKTEIRFSNISKSYPGNRLLNNLRLDLRNGSLVVLSGDNGSGKTTLLRILSGLEKPDSGYVNFGLEKEKWKRARKRLLEQVMYLHLPSVS